MASEPFAAWYRAPLNSDDLLAGVSLLALLAIFLPLYALVIRVFVKAEREIIGFRYLLSAAVADILCMVQYAGLNGIAILSKRKLVSVEARPWMQMYIDVIWYARSFHLPLVAWSRLHAVHQPLSFKCQSRRFSYGMAIAFGWISPIIFECAIHWQPFVTTFYFEPAMYGMLSDDVSRYKTDGQSTLILSVNAVCGLLPFIFYGFAIILLIKRGMSSTNHAQRVEVLLILPCLIASVVFVLGQVAVTFGTGSGKWFTWSICALFFGNSALQPLLLIGFSPFVRRSILRRQSEQDFSKVPVATRASRR